MTSVMKFILIIFTASIIGCGNCNISKGDKVRYLANGAVGEVLFIYTAGGGTDMCTGRILSNGLIVENYGADWEVIK